MTKCPKHEWVPTLIDRDILRTLQWSIRFFVLLIEFIVISCSFWRWKRCGSIRIHHGSAEAAAQRDSSFISCGWIFISKKRAKSKYKACGFHVVFWKIVKFGSEHKLWHTRESLAFSVLASNECVYMRVMLVVRRRRASHDSSVVGCVVI